MKYIIYSIFLLTVSFSFSQSWNAVTLSDSVVDFGQVQTGRRHSRMMQIINHLDKGIKISNVFFVKDEFATNLDTCNIPALGQQDFMVTFESGQNVNFRDILAINVSGVAHPLLARLSARAVYADAYYDSTQNKWGAELKDALHRRIKGHTQSSYANLWNILQDADEDPDNPDNVRLLYTGWSYPKSEHGGDNDQWNREHVWAKAHGDFGNTPPAGTDAHHICATDVSVNNARGNLDFAEGGGLYTDGDGATQCRIVNNYSWEPRQAVKGDVARMMYYMVVRYEGEEGYDLELTEQIPSAPNKEPLFAKKSTLYKWHVQDSVDARERRRNDRVYNWQHNRNPFIDHPEFAGRLPSISGITLPPGSPKIIVTPGEIDLGSTLPNDTISYYFAVINAGRAELIVSQISSTDANFIPGQNTLSVAAESYAYMKLSYIAPQEEGDYQTSLHILSNDEDQGEIQVPVKVNVSSTVSVGRSGEVVSGFKLYPNYPNPFGKGSRFQANPRTLITYSLPQSSRVRLTIYNILGQEVRTIVNERQKAGIYRIPFSGGNLPSGVYFYRLQAGPRLATGKMILMQ